MKTLKQLIQDVQYLTANDPEQLRHRLFDFLFYSPKFPSRQKQLDVLQEAREEEIVVYDSYFSQQELKTKVYIWEGKGPFVLLTHGWASKASDFAEFITLLNREQGCKVVAFDAPGNGNSEGKLTNLLLYVAAIKEITEKWGEPEVLIGHSLGAMANIIAYKSLNKPPQLLLSLTPLVDLVDYFSGMMQKTGVPKTSIDQFYIDFYDRFQIYADHFDLLRLYDYEVSNHWLFYDEQDEVSPYPLLQDFIMRHPDINTMSFKGIGHQQMLKSEQVLEQVAYLLKAL